VYLQAKRARGTVSSARKGRKVHMNYRALFPKATKRVAIVATLCALLGTVGCMIRPQAVMSPAGDGMSLTAPPINPAEDRCSQFSCEP
jgi:hypothetical protein